MNKVSQKQAEIVLQVAAEWLGKKGLGVATCKLGRELKYSLVHADDGTPCETLTIGPAPTGPEAAYRGLGPELREYEGIPSIVLEGGPYEWAIEGSCAIQKELDAKGIKVYVEPYYSFMLSIYPN
jgi:hypothetical protein